MNIKKWYIKLVRSSLGINNMIYDTLTYFLTRDRHYIYKNNLNQNTLIKILYNFTNTKYSVLIFDNYFNFSISPYTVFINIILSVGKILEPCNIYHN